MATMSASSLYGPQSGGTAGQQKVNPPRTVTGAAGPSGFSGTNGLQPIAAGLGVSVPMLIAMGVLAWYLLRIY